MLIGPGGQRRGQRTIDETEDKRDHLEMGSQWKLWSWKVINVVTKGIVKLRIMTTGNRIQQTIKVKVMTFFIYRILKLSILNASQHFAVFASNRYSSLFFESLLPYIGKNIFLNI